MAVLTRPKKKTMALIMCTNTYNGLVATLPSQELLQEETFSGIWEPAYLNINQGNQGLNLVPQPYFQLPAQGIVIFHDQGLQCLTLVIVQTQTLQILQCVSIHTEKHWLPARTKHF